MTKVLFIHGAGASPLSFKWLIEHLPNVTPELFLYSVHTNVRETLKTLRDDLLKKGDDLFVVGHSLGGLIATGLGDLPNVKGIVTLCAPFEGLPGANVISLFNAAPLFVELSQWSSTLQMIRANKIQNHLAIYGTQGLPFTSSPNDGVVTVKSATGKVGPIYHALDLNHFEVLMSDDTVTLITQFIRQNET